jgi:RNA polymerase sigma-70 factor (ECF subfamily)
MLDRPQQRELALPWKARDDMMVGNGSGSDHEKARRFRDAALPHLDDVYTLARYLLRNTADAEDAAQECYLRALRHFDAFRGPEIKPWLFAILRNICRGEFTRRARTALANDAVAEEDEDAVPLWQESTVSPELEILRQRDGNTIRRLVEELPEPFREAIDRKRTSVVQAAKWHGQGHTDNLDSCGSAAAALAAKAQPCP